MNKQQVLAIAAGETPDLDRVAQRVNEVCRSVTLDMAFKVGEIVIRELFSDNSQLWERQGVRSHSYRALAARGDLMLSASALCRAVGVYVLVQGLGGRERWHHLSASHFQEVLALEPESRNALLAQAEEQEWPVSRLRDEAAHRRLRHRGSTELHGRPLERLRSRLVKYQQHLARADLAALPDASVRSIRDTICKLHAELTEVETLLDNRTVSRAHPESDVRELLHRATESRGNPKK